MKNIGVILIMSSFLCGAFLTSLDPTQMMWDLFIPTLLVGFIGLAMVKYQHRKSARADHKLDDDLMIMEKSLHNIVVNLQQLFDEKDDLPTYEARFEIDKRFRNDLNQFAEVRDSLRHLFGLQKYADIMSAFAAGERYVNRVWSASTDGYVDEVRVYIEKAFRQFTEAQNKFVEAKTGI